MPATAETTFLDVWLTIAAYIAFSQIMWKQMEELFALSFSKQILCPAQKKDICSGARANIENYYKFKTIGTLTSTVSE